MRSKWIRFTMITLIFTLIFMTYSFGDDQEEIAKNEKLLDTVQGVERVDVLNKLSDLYTGIDNEKAIDYGNKALELSDWEQYVAGRIKAYNNLGYVYIANADMDKSLENFRNASTESIENDNIDGYAYSQNGYGIIWAFVGDYQKSISYYENAISLFTDTDNKNGLADSKNNLGAVYESTGAYDKAVTYYQEALALYEELEKKSDIAVALNNLGSINMSLGNYQNAFEFYSTALTIQEELGKKREMAITLNNIGDFYVALEYYEEGLSAYEKALELANEINDGITGAQILNNIGYMYEVEKDYDKALEFYDESAIKFDESGDYEGLITSVNNLGTVYYKQKDYQSALDYHTHAFNLSKEITYRDGLKASIKNIAYDYQQLGEYKESNYYMSLLTELTEQLINDKIAESFANSEAIFQSEKKNKEILKQKEEIQESERARKRLLTILAIIGAASVIIMFLLIWVAKERSKSERLLLNILPKKVAENLKKTGETPPVRFEDVTVYFSDVVSFTTLSQHYTPDALISELNDIFTMFDNIMEKYSCERIKTIGDAYMAVCGMPEKNPDHARLMVRAAIEIRDAMNKRNEGKDLKWEIRIGINTGRVVGGVVGIKKYIYDVFGDTINTASRMESNSKPMFINCSPTTYELIKDEFDTTYRGESEVKGKGIMKMYFINNEKTTDIVGSDNKEEKAEED